MSMKFQVIQNKGDKTSKEALDARMFGYVDPTHFINDYEVVCEITAVDMDEVFKIGNIGPESAITRLDKMHSVSVGDVIRTEDGRCYVVSSWGFARLGEQDRTLTVRMKDFV